LLKAIWARAAPLAAMLLVADLYAAASFAAVGYQQVTIPDRNGPPLDSRCAHQGGGDRSTRGRLFIRPWRFTRGERADSTDHFVFLAPCSDALAAVAAKICEDPAGFDRSAFHSAFNQSIVDFFTTRLRDR
jgi:hypothetical protein